MTAFLEQLAQALLAEHGKALREVAVVLPSQRAGLYLRNWLAREAGGALWSPEVFTIGTFIERMSGLRPLPMEELLFEAFEAYRSVEATDADLGEFLQWAPTALHDISEADAHLVPLDGFYRDLRSWEELDWSFNDTPLSSGQQRMVRYWTMKGKLHTALNTRLLAQGTGTQGLIERTAAEQGADLSGTWKAIWFAGLNAFTPAQERVLDRCRKAGIAHFAWDADSYYLNHPQQEAGIHLRKAIERFGPGIFPPRNDLAARSLAMNVVRAPNDAAQAWCAADLLHSIPEEERTRTAIILADGSLLQPLLEALPSDIGPLNITMGLPIALLPVGSFLSALHQLHASMRPGAGFFHADVERLLRHPFLQEGAGAPGIAAVVRALRTEQRTFLQGPHIRTLLEVLPHAVRPYAFAVFQEVDDVRTDMPHITTQALGWARAAMVHDGFATEQLYQAALVMQRVHALLTRYAYPLDLRAYSSVFQRLLRMAEVGLFGEPLSGLQVMGMLEARALDPSRIILLGAQEGSLPSGGADRSFIPFELRRAYQLPLRDSTDAVQAYNFLRMVQRAKQVTLVHTDNAESPGPSRFIVQLEHELFHHEAEGIPTVNLSIAVPGRMKSSVAVTKDEHTLNATKALLAKGLAPTALGDFLRCPLDFHFRRILKLREAEAPEASIASNVLGDALHRSIEGIYQPWLGSALVPAQLIDASTQVGAVLLKTLSGSIPQEALGQGEPLLQTRMATHAAERFLVHEARMVERGMAIVPQALELELEGELPNAMSLFGTPVRLKGRLDRVDTRDGLVHILDLKTGRVDQQALSVKELGLENLKGDRRYAAQLLLYAWLYLTNHPEVPAVKAGLLPLQRAAGSSGLFLKVEGEEVITRGMLPQLEAVFADAVREMLDPTVPIQHDAGSKYCAFCVEQG